MTDPTPTEMDQPERIGPYKLLDLLGEGGMGEVWLAEQSEPVHRRVALKIIKLGMDTKQVLARLEAERQALAVMDHPNIARFFDGGATEGGRPYFVMELVQGIPITNYCDTHRLTTEERIRLFIDVCQAVQHAHHKGVVHRDLKPSNTLVTVKDNTPVVKIIDFGIAKALGQELTDQTLVTRMGQIIGTPEYMSPEQAEMSGLDVDTRTDVYSLGVMLYELLVGARPFDLGAKVDQVIRYAIRETQIPKPSTRLTGLGETQDTIAEYRRTTVDGLKKELKTDLDWIILKAMEKDRTRRYETANGFAQDLERHLSNEPVLARAPSAGYRLGKFLRRRRLEATFGLIVAVLLVGSSVGMSILAARTARERDRAEREATKAQGVNEFMTRTLLAPDPVNALGADATILEALNAAVEEIEGEFSSDPEVDAAVRSSIGWAYYSLSRYDEAEPLLREAARLRRNVLDRDDPDLALSLQQLGALLEVRAKADSARSLYQEALDIRRSTNGRYDTGMAETLVRLSGVQDDREAQASLEEAIEILEVAGADPIRISAATNRLATLLWNSGELDQAEALFREVLSERMGALPPDHPLVGEGLNNLAVVLEDLDRPDEALAFYREALASVEASFGESSDHVSSVLGNMALILSNKGETEEAEALFRRALDIDLGLFGEEHPSVAIDGINLGLLLCDTDRASEGLPMTRRGSDVIRETFGPEDFNSGVARAALGNCLAKAGRFGEGERELLGALATVEAAVGPDHPRIERIHHRLAELYDAWGKPEEAREYRREV